MASNTGPQPRAAHLLDDITSRDLYGTVRGACKGCSDCGRYIIKTKENYTSRHQSTKGTQRHPDNDPSITFCSRCGCPPDAHEIVIWENERELGSDAFALHQWDSALVHYTRAIDLHSFDATLWTNRAATYLAKGWHAQALHDAQHAISLRPEWFRPWARKGAALLGLGKAQEALEAYQMALKCAENDEIVNEGTVSVIKKAMQEAEKKVLSQKRKTVTSAQYKPQIAAEPVKIAAVPSRRATVDPRTPAHTEEIKTEISSSFSPEAKHFNDDESNVDVDSNHPVDDAPSSSLSGSSKQKQQMLFAEVKAQYNEVIRQVEALKALMDKLQEQISKSDNVEQPQQGQQEHTENEFTLDKDSTDGDSIISSSNKSSRDGSEATEDGAVEDIDELKSNSGSEVDQEEKEVERKEEKGFDVPSSPILRRRTTDPISESNSNSESGRDEGGKSQQQLEESNQDFSADEEEVQTRALDSSDNEFDAEFEWLDTIQAARKQLYGTDQTIDFGFVPPPPPFSSDASLSSQRRKPKNNFSSGHYNIKDDTTDQGMNSPIDTTTIANTSKNDSTVNNRGTASSKLDLGSLQSLLVAAAVKQRRRDPLGVDRCACKICGTTKCPQYENNSVGNALSAAILEQQQQQPKQQQSSQQFTMNNKSSRECSSCGCDCTAHETEEEATAREDAEQRAKEREERIKRQREERQRQQQRHRQPPPSPETERIKRVVAAAARKAAAEEASEPLQCTDCDVLTQSKRGSCTACKACSGFKIYYSSTDANNPEIMLYCATCGCTAESHPIDSSWEQKEAARREAENAAAARAAARARHSFHTQAAASADARKEEAAAYAVLGLHYGADSKAVTRAYKRLALKLHPDKVIIARRNSGEENSEIGEDAEAAEVAEAHAAFVKITQAYKFLSELKQ